MPAKPSKYPDIDPREPGVYRRILEAAAEMRSHQQTDAVIFEARRRATRVASLTALRRSEVDAQLSKKCESQPVSPLEKSTEQAAFS